MYFWVFVRTLRCTDITLFFAKSSTNMEVNQIIITTTLMMWILAYMTYSYITLELRPYLWSMDRVVVYGHYRNFVKTGISEINQYKSKAILTRKLNVCEHVTEARRFTLNTHWLTEIILYYKFEYRAPALHYNHHIWEHNEHGFLKKMKYMV